MSTENYDRLYMGLISSASKRGAFGIFYTINQSSVNMVSLEKWIYKTKKIEEEKKRSKIKINFFLHHSTFAYFNNFKKKNILKWLQINKESLYLFDIDMENIYSTFEKGYFLSVITLKVIDQKTGKEYQKPGGGVMHITLTWSDTEKYGKGPVNSPKLIDAFSSDENKINPTVFMIKVSDIVGDGNTHLDDYQIFTNHSIDYVKKPSTQEEGDEKIDEEKIQTKRKSPKNHQTMLCSSCSIYKHRSDFSRRQLKKKDGCKCKQCINNK